MREGARGELVEHLAVLAPHLHEEPPRLVPLGVVMREVRGHPETPCCVARRRRIHKTSQEPQVSRTRRLWACSLTVSGRSVCSKRTDA